MLSANSQQTKRFLLLGTRTAYLEGVAGSLLHAEGTECEVFTSVTAAIDRLRTPEPFDAVFFDSPGRSSDHLQDLSIIVGAAGSVPVAIICDELDAGLLEASMDRGAHGIVLTSMSLNSFSAALSMLATGESYLPAEYIKMLRSRGGLSLGPFSQKELTVLRELASGATNREISERHSIAIATVKMHVQSVCKKLEVKSRLHAVAIARKRGLV